MSLEELSIANFPDRCALKGHKDISHRAPNGPLIAENASCPLKEHGPETSTWKPWPRLGMFSSVEGF